MARRVLYLVAAAVAALSLSGCGIFDKITGVGIESRIASFARRLNADDRSTVYLQFHPALTTRYEELKEPTFWDEPFPVPAAADAAYRITVVSSTWPRDPAAVVASMSGPAAFGANRDVELTMAKDGKDWMIRAIYMQGNDGGWAAVVD